MNHKLSIFFLILTFMSPQILFGMDKNHKHKENGAAAAQTPPSQNAAAASTTISSAELLQKIAKLEISEEEYADLNRSSEVLAFLGEFSKDMKQLLNFDKSLANNPIFTLRTIKTKEIQHHVLTRFFAFFTNKGIPVRKLFEDNIYAAILKKLNRKAREVLKTIKAVFNTISDNDITLDCVLPQIDINLQRLIDAAQSGDEPQVQKLLAAGVNPYQFNQFGFSPLYYAIFFDHTNIIKMIANKCPQSVNQMNFEGIVPYLLIIQFVKRTPLHDIMDSFKATVNGVDDQIPPLTQAILAAGQTGGTLVVEALLAQKANIKYVYQNKTPYQVAKEKLLQSQDNSDEQQIYADIIELLAGKGAEEYEKELIEKRALMQKKLADLKLKKSESAAAELKLKPSAAQHQKEESEKNNKELELRIRACNNAAQLQPMQDAACINYYSSVQRLVCYYVEKNYSASDLLLSRRSFDIASWQIMQNMHAALQKEYNLPNLHQTVEQLFESAQTAQKQTNEIPVFVKKQHNQLFALIDAVRAQDSQTVQRLFKDGIIGYSDGIISNEGLFLDTDHRTFLDWANHNTQPIKQDDIIKAPGIKNIMRKAHEIKKYKEKNMQIRANIPREILNNNK